MKHLIAYRLLQGIPVLLLVVTVTFILIHQAPGGPFDAERAVPAEVLKNLEQKYRLDQPVYLQYFHYLGDILHGDFGPSFRYPNRDVTELIATGLPITFELAFYAMLVALSVGLMAGMVSALRPGTWQDHVPMSLAMIGICLPTFLLGPVLVLVFGIWLEWLPVSGWGYAPGDKILPAVTLGAAYAAYIARLTRGGMLEILNQEFIVTAKAKGLSMPVILWKHAMRGGLSPVVAFLGPAVAGLLTGSFVVETIFQIPGLGRFYIQAAFNRDYTMILGTTILLSCLVVLLNIVADLIAAWMNPRLRGRRASA